MDMDPRLVIMTVGYSLGIVLTVALGFFVWIKAKKNPLSTVFLFMNLSIAIVEVSMIMVANADSPRMAEIASLLNMANIFIVVFMAHWILEVIGKSREKIIPIILIYTGGFALFFYYILDPSAFLFPAVPKMYLAYYFQPALWYTLMRVYFAIVTVYFLYELFRSYKLAHDNILRNRLKYVFSGIVFGMVTGHIAVPLVYGIQVDPLWSMLFPLYTVPMAYAVVHYELMDIKIVARRALFYALTVGFLSALLGIVGFSNDILRQAYPSFPGFIVPVSVAILASAVGLSVWFRVKESEMLKYEFITVVTHKFRTPLTQIKWAIDSARSSGGLPTVVNDGLRAIDQASSSLVELTNTLVKATESEDAGRKYHFESVALGEILSGALKKFQKHISEKHLNIRFISGDNSLKTQADKELLVLVLETIIENAVNYTPSGGTIDISINRKDKEGIVTITDSGIGISREDLTHIFERFFRSDEARRIMTEGLGIGLFIAKQIIDRHGGTIKAISEGHGKGSTMIVSLKMA